MWVATGVKTGKRYMSADTKSMLSQRMIKQYTYPERSKEGANAKLRIYPEPMIFERVI